MKSHGTPGPVPFFLAADPGERFCIHHAPAGYARGTIVYLHPFAEELNKTRRMAALQARAFAGQGFHVLQIDLFGCGDSDGDFADARWSIWKSDLMQACRWARAQNHGPIYLWGLRLGCLLALDFIRDHVMPVDGLIWWQPVLDGRAHLHQFRRVQQAARLLATSSQVNDDEVAGYTLAPALVRDIEQLHAAAYTPDLPLHWLDLGNGAAGVPSASLRQFESWRAAGLPVRFYVVAGRPFWTSAEILDCPATLTATSRLELS